MNEKHGSAAPDDHGGAGQVEGIRLLVERVVKGIERLEDLRSGRGLALVGRAVCCDHRSQATGISRRDRTARALVRGLRHHEGFCSTQR